jgi:folate-dependent phosphoribosylglycinamide formyltransferase PurN
MPKCRIALLTSGNLRHRWVAARLAQLAELVCVVSEAKPQQNAGATIAEAAEMRGYFAARDLAERRWFGDAPDHFSQVATEAWTMPWQGANSPEVFERLMAAEIDRLFLFGSSIIREPLLSNFQGRIVNMHLGLSPYYRGSATNYWPLVDGVPECVGVTIHHATAIVDGGGILAQARPDPTPADDVHDLGCKTIMAGAKLLQQIAQWPVPLPDGVRQTCAGKLCRRADFSIDSLRQVQALMEQHLLSEYLSEKAARDLRYPIVQADVSKLP